MRRAIYPGSFDPITNGHIDVTERALRLFDEVIIAVAANEQKRPLFNLDERMELIEQSVGSLQHKSKLKIKKFEGLLVDFAVEQQATAIVRGMRAVSDFEFEFQLALMNRKLNADIETIFLMPKENYVYLSSRIIKEITRLKGDISSFVPAAVVEKLHKKFAK